MKGMRLGAVALVVAGAFLVVSLVKQVVFPGFIEFALITGAHLLVAVGVGLVAAGLIRPRGLGVVLGTAWGAGWLFFGAAELVMLFFVFPPRWLSPAAVVLILAGGAAAVIAYAATSRGSRGRPLGPVGLLVFALLSSAPLWVYLLIEPFPGLLFTVGYWLRVAGDVAAALAILLTGVWVLRRSREPSPEVTD